MEWAGPVADLVGTLTGKPTPPDVLAEGQRRSAKPAQ